MTVHWAVDRVRLDQTAPPDQVERTIVGPDDAVVFTAPWIGTDRQHQSGDYVARIKPASKSGQPLAHPLNQGVPMYTHNDRLALSRYLRSARQRKLKMDVSRKDKLIRIGIDDPERFSRREFIVDPSQGYSVVTYRSWLTKHASNEPETTIETSYVEGPPGIFLMSRLVQKKIMLLQESDKSTENQKITTELECQLISADFAVAPDAELFTIDSLGLPVGARIEDTIQGKTYHYGVDAPATAAIDNIEWTASGPHPTGNQWRWYMSAAILAIVILSIVVFQYRSRVRN